AVPFSELAIFVSAAGYERLFQTGNVKRKSVDVVIRVDKQLRAVSGARPGQVIERGDYFRRRIQYRRYQDAGCLVVHRERQALGKSEGGRGRNLQELQALLAQPGQC